MWRGLVLALLVAGCAREAKPPAAPSSEPGAQSAGASGAPAESPASEVGEASYYGNALAGHATASGDRYDPRALTAAHRTLPFGTIVRVTRRDDGRSVVVRVNDRGPFGSSRRIIDVSRAAAEQLHMLRAGVVAVRLDVLELGQGRKRH